MKHTLAMKESKFERLVAMKGAALGPGWTGRCAERALDGSTVLMPGLIGHILLGGNHYRPCY